MSQAQPTPAASARRSKQWLRWIAIVIAALWTAEVGLSWLVAHSRLKRRLTARLEAAFGRPVEVSRYRVSLLGGPRLEAEGVTVGEDRRFGDEYFLRAEGVAISLRWPALLRGRVELGTLSFTRPSLNLVRAGDGEWNLANWLPRPAAATYIPGSAGAGAAPNIARIEFDSGRINFKRGPDKLAFALAAVNGRVEEESPGRWRIDLEAEPVRAAVVLQQAGTIRLQGFVGGTSARLRPAEIELNWQDASLSDVLRLWRGTDYGVRGLFSLILKAQAEDQQWVLVGRAETRKLHRWDLPLRPDDPAANLAIDARWLPEKSRLEVAQALLETPRSTIRAAGFLGWSELADASLAPSRDAQLQIFPSSVHLDDVFSWVRAFHPGVADELALQGTVGVNVLLRGWPLRIERGTVTAENAQLAGGSVHESARADRAVAELGRSRIDLAPVTIELGRDGSSLQLEAAARRRAGWESTARIAGDIGHIEDLFGAAAALGWPLSRGWSITGPAHFDLRWQGKPNPLSASPLGKIELGGVTVRAPFLNQPISQMKGRIELRPGARMIALTSAQAFGTRWSGALERRTTADDWDFNLTADRLSASDLDRWLNPRWREGLLERLLPFLTTAPAPVAVPAGLRGTGRLLVDHFQVAPLVVQHLRGELSVDGRSVDLENAEAEFYGGAVRGSFHAELTAEPIYRVVADFERVDLASLANSTKSLKDRFAGSAGGHLEMEARGLGRPNLAMALTCRGNLQVQNAEMDGYDLAASLRAATLRPGATAFPLASAGFTCGAGAVKTSNLAFTGPRMSLLATGSMDFLRNLDFTIRAFPPSVAEIHSQRLADPPEGPFRVTGTLDSPQLVPIGNPGR